MPKEMSIVVKNLVLKGHTTDDKAMFKLVSSGDIKITADPDTILAAAKYLKGVIRNEA